MRHVLVSLLVACLAAAGLLSFAAVVQHSDMHARGETCLASSVQGSACMPDVANNPLEFLSFHLQAVQQLGDGLVVATVLLGLFGAALAIAIFSTTAPPGTRSGARVRASDAATPPRVAQLLTHWLALLEKRDPALAA